MSSSDDNSANTTPVLAITLAVIAFLGVSTTFIPSSWLNDSSAENTMPAGDTGGNTASVAASHVVADQAIDTKQPETAQKPTLDATQAQAQSLPDEKKTGSATQPPDTTLSEQESPTQNTAKVAKNKPDTKPTKPVPAKQSPAAMHIGIPPRSIQWRPPHMASQQRDTAKPTRPIYPQPLQYPYPYNPGYPPYPPQQQPVPPRPYPPANTGR